MSGIEQNIIKQAKQMHQPIPDRIKNKPILNADLMLYFDAYLILQDDRNSNNKIPWTVKIKYSETYHFSEIQTERLIYFLTEMDLVYIKWLAEKRKRNA